MRNAGLDEAQAGIKIAGRNINNLRYADDTTLMNCIILGRAEAFASKNSVGASALDGIGIGLGFTLSLTVVGMVREILGEGAIFGVPVVEGDGLMPLVFILAPGGFLVLGYLMVMFNKIAKR